MSMPYPITTTSTSMSSFIVALRKKRRMKKIGSGCFATAYGSKTGRTVVKIGIVREQISWSADANLQYLRYLKLTEKYADNPFFPKVKGVQLFRHTATDELYMVVEMEKLKPLKRRSEDVGSLLECIMEDPDSFKAAKIIFGKLSDHLAQAHKVLYTMSEKYCASFDIHGDNVMLRGKSQLVITDPVT